MSSLSFGYSQQPCSIASYNIYIIIIYIPYIHRTRRSTSLALPSCPVDSSGVWANILPCLLFSPSHLILSLCFSSLLHFFFLFRSLHTNIIKINPEIGKEEVKKNIRGKHNYNQRIYLYIST